MVSVENPIVVIVVRRNILTRRVELFEIDTIVVLIVCRLDLFGREGECLSALWRLRKVGPVRTHLAVQLARRRTGRVSGIAEVQDGDAAAEEAKPVAAATVVCAAIQAAEDAVHVLSPPALEVGVAEVVGETGLQGAPAGVAAAAVGLSVYIVVLALLLCYPRFWRNVGYVLLTGIGLLLLPALHGGVEGLLSGYQNWLAQLVSHQSTGIYYSFLFLPGIRSFALPYMRLFQVSVLLLMAIPFLLPILPPFKGKVEVGLPFRVGLLAALMGYIVLFSEAAEYTTYTITMTGYALWYFLEDKRPLVDRILFWALFVLWCVMPIDLFCPSKLCNYIHSTLWIGVLTYTVAWVRMIYFTCTRSLRNS